MAEVPFSDEEQRVDPAQQDIPSREEKEKLPCRDSDSFWGLPCGARAALFQTPLPLPSFLPLSSFRGTINLV